MPVRVNSLYSRPRIEREISKCKEEMKLAKVSKDIFELKRKIESLEIHCLQFKKSQAGWKVLNQQINQKIKHLENRSSVRGHQQIHDESRALLDSISSASEKESQGEKFNAKLIRWGQYAAVGMFLASEAWLIYQTAQQAMGFFPIQEVMGSSDESKKAFLRDAKEMTDLCSDSRYAQMCEGNLGIVRNLMPQFTHEVMGNFSRHLEGQGISVGNETVRADLLHPSQCNLVAKKVASMTQDWLVGVWTPCKDGDPFIISEDDYVIDGHHRWAVCAVQRELVSVYRISLPATKIFEMLKGFPGVTQATHPGTDVCGSLSS